MYIECLLVHSIVSKHSMISYCIISIYHYYCLIGYTKLE